MKNYSKNLELSLEGAERPTMEEQKNWRAIPFKDGYKIIYSDDLVEISIIAVTPNDIEETQQKILKGLNAINSSSSQTNKYQPISLPPLLPKEDG